MIANKRYRMGKPILSDDEYDTLRKKLKGEGSVVALHDEATCKLDTGICKVRRGRLSNTARAAHPHSSHHPAPLVHRSTCASTTRRCGCSTSPAWRAASSSAASSRSGRCTSTRCSRSCSPPSPPTSSANGSLRTSLRKSRSSRRRAAPRAAPTPASPHRLTPGPLVTQAPCPKCNALTTVYFGDFFSVKIDGVIAPKGPPEDVLEVKCATCSEKLTADRGAMILQTQGEGPAASPTKFQPSPA